MGDRVACVALPIGRPSLLEGIEGAVNGAVADGVHVHLNALCIKVVYKAGEVFLRPNRRAAPMLAEPGRLQVGLLHDGGAAFGHSIVVNLHGIRRNHVCGGVVVGLDGGKHFVIGESFFHSGDDAHAQGQVALALYLVVHIDNIKAALGDIRNAGYAIGVCFLHEFVQGLFQLVVGHGVGHDGEYYSLGGIADAPRRLAVLIAIEQAAFWVGGVGGYAGQFEGLGIDPSGVVGDVVDEHGLIGADGV